MAALVAVVASGPANAAVSEEPVPTPVFNGPVYAVATAGNVVYVGGDFESAVVKGKQVARTRLAAFDAGTGALLSWAPAADRTVRAVAVDPDGSVWAGGDFQTVDGQPRDSLAKISSAGVLDPVSFTISGGTPRALAVGHGRLYVAGAFNAVNGVKRGNVAAIDLATRTLSGWSARTDNVVNALAVDGGRVYLGGSFHRVNGVSSTTRLVAVKRDGGAVDLSFLPRPDSIVWGVTVSGDRVYAALGGRGGRTVSYTTNGVAKWAITTDGDAQAVAVLGNTVYIGGHFDNVCRTARNGDHGLCLDGSVSRIKLAATDLDGKLQSWSPQGNGIRGVLALVATTQTGVIAAGEFTVLDGKSQKRLAVFR
ncbi:hypothetical protein [Virgisporangium aurantiacum]|uniref:hypothetical protein n=1 Tax=Virgisporangium aurantiacum TaxID=175570 RepID=UPI001EF2848E|nr:hypothetical protein [Virgisporangium aurantiacum]